MKRGLFIGTGALVGAFGALLYPAEAVSPEFLTGPSSAPQINGGGNDNVSAQERTIDGDAIDTRYGPVQVQLTVNGTTITAVNMLQVPTGGRDQQFTDYAIPILTQETLDAQSANISVASGASFTSYGFIQSLQSALAKM